MNRDTANPARALGTMRELSTEMVQNCSPNSIEKTCQEIRIVYVFNDLTLVLSMDGEYDITFVKAELQKGKIKKILHKTGNLTIEGENSTRVIDDKCDHIGYTEALGEFHNSVQCLKTRE